MTFRSLKIGDKFSFISCDIYKVKKIYDECVQSEDINNNRIVHFYRNYDKVRLISRLESDEMGLDFL